MERKHYKYKVCVRCMTFNHAKYIEDAMDGFCKQETVFPYVCCIVDDSSTDGEQKVINNYLNTNFVNSVDSGCFEKETDYARIEYVQHKSNPNCFFLVLFLKYNHNGSHELRQKKIHYLDEWRENSQYEAVCEGDDYWVDSRKIQKQADILDQHPSVYMVYSDYITVNEHKEKILRPKYDYYKSFSQTGDILPALLKTNFPLTLTVMLRPQVYKSDLYINAPATIDYLIFVSASFLGDVYYILETTGAYRMSPNGLMLSNQEGIKRVYDKLYPYIFLEYVKGHVKKMSFTHDVLSRHRIIHKVWDCYPFLIRDIVRINPSYVFYFMTVFIDKIFYKIRNFLSLNKK